MYVKKSVEAIIFLSVGGTVLARTETCHTFLLLAVARVNLIDVNTTKKNGQDGCQDCYLRSMAGCFLIGLIGLSSIKTVLNMHLVVHRWFPSCLSLCLTFDRFAPEITGVEFSCFAAPL
jgi:hypothetical protein